MADRSGPTAYYLAQLQAFRRADKDRDDMVADLVIKYEELMLKYRVSQDDLENEVEARRMWKTKADITAREAGDLRRAAESNPFAFAIIDGDGAIFQDKFLKLAADGGAEAAHQLHSALKDYLLDTYPEANTEDWTMVIQVVLNLEGLSKALQSCGIIKSPDDFQAFARAFGRTQPLFSFIDVGAGKERADHKVRETLRLMLRVSQCKHVFFGPCHDAGYLPVLETYKRDQAIASKITLIETVRALAGFTQLGFKHTNLDNIFRKENLVVVSRPPELKTVSASGASQPHPHPATNGVKPGTYAVTAISGAGLVPSAVNIAPKKPVKRKYYLLNKYGERVDEDLPRPEPIAERRFQDRMQARGKCCNKFQLRGECDQGEYCQYASDHYERLSPPELLVLRHKARSIRCSLELYCEDAACALGHHCKFGNRCTIDSCRFRDTHHVELRAVTRVYEDGTRELVH